MAAATGNRMYGGTASDFVADKDAQGDLIPYTGNLQPRSSPGGSVITTLLDAAGSSISQVPVTNGIPGQFQVPQATPVYVSMLDGWVKLTPNDLLDAIAGLTTPTLEADDISDASTVGKAVVTAPNAAAAREAIGAGVPVTVPGELAVGDLEATDTVVGTITGRRLWAAFLGYYSTTGQPWVLKWTGTAWPNRNTVPAGFTGQVLWDSTNDANATQPPPTMIPGDDTLELVETTS